MWEEIRANRRRSAFLVVAMAGLLFGLGWALGEVLLGGYGSAGLVLAFLVWMVLTLVSYFQGDTIFLKLSRAREIKRDDHPVLWNVVEEMQIAAGLATMPRVFIIEDPAPNAFATGRKPETASVAVTTGLLERLSRDELQGVVAHELGHIDNRDVLYMMIVGVMLGTVVLLADVGVRSLFWGGGRTTDNRGSGQAQLIMLAVALVIIILAPIAAQLIYFAVSRKREYLADATGARLTRYPPGLASALEKISSTPKRLKSATRATAPMYIVNPFRQATKKWRGLVSTHPSTEERVRILRSMAGGAGLVSYDSAFKQVTGRPVGVVPAGALRRAEEVAERGQEAPDSSTALGRLREATDALWRAGQFVFIACACGTRLKVPPDYAGRTISCPHCDRPQRVERPSEGS
jgi:heat shock protein HtpX